MDKKNEKIDWTRYYCLIGNFVINFENVVYQIREQSCFLLECRGLKDYVLAQIVFGQKSFSAEPLLSCYVSMVHHVIKNVDGSKPILERLTMLKNRFSKLIHHRNDIVHGTHFSVEWVTITGPIDPEPFKGFKAIKSSPKGTGYSQNEALDSQIQQYMQELEKIGNDFKSFTEVLNAFLKTHRLIEPQRKN